MTKRASASERYCDYMATADFCCPERAVATTYENKAACAAHAALIESRRPPFPDLGDKARVRGTHRRGTVYAVRGNAALLTSGFRSPEWVAKTDLEPLARRGRGGLGTER